MNLTLTHILTKIEVLLQDISPAFALAFGFLKNPMLQPNFTFWVDCIVFADRQMGRDEFEKKIADDFINQDMVVELNQTSQMVLTTQVLAEEHGDDSFCDLFQWESSQYYVVSLSLNGTDVTFSENSELKMIHVESDGKLIVCKELLNKKMYAFEMINLNHVTPVQDDLTKIALYLCTLCSFGASILFLILTLVSYLRFSFLRTVAGSSNMFLCVSLMLAQTLLLASSHVNAPSPVCTALGILTHFTWLWMFMWNLMCSYHMFRVFTAKTRPVALSNRAEVVLLLRRCALSLLVPLVIVLTVVCSSIVVTSGASIGYGQGKCYLDSTLLVGVSLIGPLLLILVCNISFFAVTVYTINNIRNLQMSDSVKNDNKRNMYVYVRLSTITGVFWFVAIFAEAFDLDPLRFIAVFLNGFEGVFIFLSYVCNKRVLGLHRQGTKFKLQRGSQRNDNPSVAEENGQQEANE
ncbi:probable G-protein coupled receptor Mth-like 11 [Physella acuta]|uniref:probable G-protein coupled receptor Mth-like 11 n=1 Tax=Physella acuta TaxID=109671 RepID=UPI0027DDA45C|nr:probable G-protein coupled receptor Mth-like 11 [Physella acuta]